MIYLRSGWLAAVTLTTVVWLTTMNVAVAADEAAAAAAISAAEAHTLLANFVFDRQTGASDVERRADVRMNDDEHITDDSAAAAAVESGRSATTHAMAAKEQHIRGALQRATQNAAFRRQFVQMVPIVRSLSRQQRLVLASLINAQVGAAPGKALSMQQVGF